MMNRAKSIVFAAVLAAAVSAPVHAAAVDPADRAAAIAANLDTAGDRLLAVFTKLSEAAAAKGRTALADRLLALGVAANARLDALACRFDPTLPVCMPAA